VVDMYRFLIEHPRWIPAERLARLDIRAGAGMGRLYRVRPPGQPLRPVRDLTRLAPPALAKALNSPNGTERDRVHAELLHRRDPASAETLVRLAHAAVSEAARLQALCALDGLGLLRDEVLLAFAPPTTGIGSRAYYRLLEKRIAAGGPNTRAMLQLVTKPGATLEQRIQQSLVLGATSDASAGRFLADLATQHAGDPAVRAAVLSSAVPHASAILSAIRRLPADHPGREEWLSPLLATVAATLPPDELARQLAILLPALDSPALPPDAEQRVFATSHVLAERMPTEGWSPKSPEEASLPEAELVAIREFPKRWQRLLDLARIRAGANANPAPDLAVVRHAAIQLLSRHGTQPGDVTLLARFAMEESAPALRQFALSGLRRQPAALVAERILERWSRASPAARAGAVGAQCQPRETWGAWRRGETSASVVGRLWIGMGRMANADRGREGSRGGPGA